MAWVQMSHSSRGYLSGLRGFASMVGMDDQEGLSPRVRQLHDSDYIKKSEPDDDDSYDRGGGIRFGGVETIRRLSRTFSVTDRSWYNVCGSRLFFPIMTLILSVVFSVFLAMYIWQYRKPRVTEGAFGKLAQNMRPESMQQANFVKARERAVSGPNLLGVDFGGNDTILGAADGYEWRRVELIYQVREGSITNFKLLKEAKVFENMLKDLPGWKRLCDDRVPERQRHFCNPGDSFAAVIFAIESSVDPALAAQGVLVENLFNGRGPIAFMPLTNVVSYLVNFHPEVFMRWYKIDVRTTPVSEARVMRTLFSFYLPSSSTAEWTAFLKDELEARLIAGVEEVSEWSTWVEGIQDVTLFYRADGLLHAEFPDAVQNAIFWACVAGLGAGITTVLVTRRVLLACTTLMLAAISSATSSAAVSRFHEDGFVEFPVVAIASWFLNCANSADLAIACVGAWEIEDDFPHTGFAEICRVCAKILERWERPSYKLWIGFWVLAQGFARMLEKAFPKRVPNGEDIGTGAPRKTPLTDWFALGRMYWFLVHLLLPPVVTGFCFVLIGIRTELLLLQEFSRHAGPGLLVSAFFAALLYPPVIDLGDLCNERMQKCGLTTKVYQFVANHFLPLECGAVTEWRGRLRPPLEIVALMLNGGHMRIVAFVLTVAVVVGFSVSEFTSAFVATPPPLFPQGHRSREGPKVRDMFGMLPRNLEAPENTLATALKCAPDAYDNATCSWYKCEVHQKITPAEGNCMCKQRWGATTTPTTTLAPISTTTFGLGPANIGPVGTCSAVARIAGLKSDANFPQSEFWKWAEGILGTILGDGNSQVLEPQRMGGIEMQDWQTGDFKVSNQFSLGLKIANDDVPKFEDACVSLLCYCGISPCKVSGDWVDFGQFSTKTMKSVPIASTTERRLATGHLSTETERSVPFATTTEPLDERHSVADGQEELQRRTLPPSGPSLFLDHRRLTIERGILWNALQKEQDTTAVINIIWGLKQSDEIPFRTSTSDLKFNTSFEMEDPWMQRSMAGFCEGVSPELRIVSTECWVLDFKRWLAGQGHTFPVRPSEFNDRFFQFTVNRVTYQKSASNVAGGAAIGGNNGYDYFWLAESGRIRGTFASFKVDAPRPDERLSIQDLMSAWTAYLESRNDMYVSKRGGLRRKGQDAWMASTLFSQSQTTEIVESSCWLAVGTLMGVGMLMTFVITCSLGITLAVVITLALSLCTFATFWMGAGNHGISSMEIVSLSVFLSGLATPLLRVASAYAYARDRPHMPPHLLMDTTDVPICSPSIMANAGLMTMAIKDPTLTVANLQEYSKQKAEAMGEGEILMFPGAINIERQSRVATAMQRGGAAALGMGGAAVVGGLALLPLEMEALGQVGLAILCMGVAVTPAIGFLSLLLLLGLGDSKARSKAMRELLRHTAFKLSGKVPQTIVRKTGILPGRMAKDNTLRSSRRLSSREEKLTGIIETRKPTEPHENHVVAAMMLGAPLGLATGTATSIFFKPKEKKEQSPEDDQQKSAADEDDLGHETGPCIMTLDVQGATAKPPYHIVMATRDVINVKG